MAHYAGAAVNALLELKGRGVLQDLTSNVGQSELVYFPIKGLFIDPDVHGLLYGPGDIVCLPTHYGEIAHTDVMTRGFTMVIEWGGALGCSLNLSPNSLLTHLYTLPYNSYSHTLTCRLSHFSMSPYACICRPPGGFWRNCLL